MLTFNPESVSRGVASTVTLNKAELLALVPVDNYFSDSNNWKKVVTVYKSDSNNQNKILSFDSSKELPTASFLISDKSVGNFLLEKIIIQDFDYGSFVISRSEITDVTNFDAII